MVRYSMMIRWSEADRAFLVWLPEFTDVAQPCTHGETYEDAAKSGREVLEMLVEHYQQEGQPLPAPDLVTHGQVAESA